MAARGPEWLPELAGIRTPAPQSFVNASQTPEAQSASALHASPSGSGPQRSSGPGTMTQEPDMQSASFAQRPPAGSSWHAPVETSQ